MEIRKGTGVYGGIAIAKIHVLQTRSYDFNNDKVEDVNAEIEVLLNAKKKALIQLDDIYKKTFGDLGEEHAAIFEVHKMMLEDEDFHNAIVDKIKVESYNAAYAVDSVGKEFSEIFSNMEDDYMKERAADILDISRRLLDNILGDEMPDVFSNDPIIILAEDLSPSQTIGLSKDRISAFVTKLGSTNSHTAILARMMNIPSLVNTDIEISDEYNGKMAIVDGYAGRIYISPDDMLSQKMDELQKGDLEEKEKLLELKGKENVTLDGRYVNIFANIGGPDDVKRVLEADAGGIGLFRSEFLYLSRNDYPTEDEQFNAYKQVAQDLNGKSVVIRTLDIGADKKVGYFNLPKEDNPAMGYRAIRICLDRVEIFKTQLRAIYRASAFGNISIMFPMIISVKEVLKIKEICKEVREELDSKLIAYDKNIKHGVMIETPAAVWVSEELAKEVDFFSVGTNDLTQYTLAIDRQNQSLSDIYDAHHPAILKSLKFLTDNAHKAGIWVGICGELASDMSLTEEFLRIGIDELSVSAPFVLPLREKVRSIDLSKQ